MKQSTKLIKVYLRQLSAIPKKKDAKDTPISNSNMK